MAAVRMKTTAKKSAVWASCGSIVGIISSYSEVIGTKGSLESKFRCYRIRPQRISYFT